MPASKILKTLYAYTAAGTSDATILTADATYGTVVRKILAVNTDSAAHTATLTVVRKGGTATDAYAVPLAVALSIPATSTADLLAGENLESALDELQLMAGDTLYGHASDATVYWLVLGA